MLNASPKVSSLPPFQLDAIPPQDRWIRDLWENVRRQDRDRFLAALFASPAQREALLLLYGFHLEIARTREVVREPLLGQIRLQWWRQGVATLYDARNASAPDSGNPAAAPVAEDHPLLSALAALTVRYGLERDHFDRLIDSRESDLEPEPAPPADLSALEDRIISTTLPLVTLAWQVLTKYPVVAAGSQAADSSGPAAALPPAVRAATLAWGLTGAVRATPFLARQQRTLLPATLLDQHGVRLSALYAGQPGPGLKPVVTEVMATAARHHHQYRAALGALSRAEIRVLQPLLLPAALAVHDRKVLARAGFDPFHPRALHNGLGRMLALLGGALWSGALLGWGWGWGPALPPHPLERKTP